MLFPIHICISCLQSFGSIFIGPAFSQHMAINRILSYVPGNIYILRLLDKDSVTYFIHEHKLRVSICISWHSNIEKTLGRSEESL